MKRWLWILALLAVTVGALVQQSSRGQVPGSRAPSNPGDLGPGAGGATLRLPGSDPSPAPAYAANPYAPPAAAPNPYASPGGSPGMPPFPARSSSTQIALPPSNHVDLNKDITITPDVGPWTILVMSYTTPRHTPDTPGLDAARMARDFVTEWNTNPAYGKFKLKAHVFNLGAEEKQREYERVQKLKQEQIAALNQLGLTGRSLPIHIQTIQIDEHTAVLLGGFKDADAAMAVAKKIREIRVDNDFAKRVKVDCRFSAAFEPEKGPGKALSVQGQVAQYVNPFTKAMPVRNPSIKQEQMAATPTAELEFLRIVNQGENLNLLNSKKPWTLAVKQFNTGYRTMTDAKEAKGFVEKFTSAFGKSKADEWMDKTAHNAHNLADALRKTGLEAYVLHCQCCSYVTVGSYASMEDPQLVQMQRFLETHFQDKGFLPLDMFPRPVPMPVPGMVKQ